VATTTVRTFSDQDSAASWGAQMHVQGYSVAMSNAASTVKLLKEDGSAWAPVPAAPGGTFVVMAFNKTTG
jgi:hypothetical protein